MRHTFLLSIVLLSVAIVRAENWPQFRGPDGNGITTTSPLPARWDAKTNIRWRAEVPGEGFSSPVAWEDRIFVTSAKERGERRLVHCLDRETGKLLWSREVVHKSPERASAMTGHAAATPVTDGKHVVAFFGSASVVCFDFTGKEVWRRALGEFDSELGLASSPILHSGRVYLVCDHDGDRFSSFDPYLVALEVTTGKEVWKTERRGAERSWSTPILVLGADGKQELIVGGSEHLRAYDPDTGKELWRVAGTTNWVAPSPVFGHGLVLMTSGKNGPTIAVKPGGRGDVTKTHVVWRHDRGGPYVASPVLYDGLLYLADEEGFVSCLDAKTGKQLYRERLGGKVYASPIAGDGKVWITNEAGVTFVIRAGVKFELLAKNDLGDYSLASPAVAGTSLLLRTEKYLYCISSR